jgi:hypothetical protein
MFKRRSGRLALVLCVLVASGCGGGGGSDGSSSGGTSNPPPPTAPTTPATPTLNSMKVTSEPGDYIGDGKSHSYSNANADFTVAVQGGLLLIQVHGNERWNGQFQMPSGYTNLATGTYNGLKRYSFHDPAIGGLNWSSDYRGCNGLNGTVTIRKVVYEGPALAELDLQFTQYCDDSSFALRGEFFWNEKDTTTSPGPTAPPAGLWQPAAGVTPGSGTYVYLESQPDDYIGVGRTYLYTPTNAVINAGEGTGNVSIALNGDEGWNGLFQGMSKLSRLEPGYYANLRWYAEHNPAVGGLYWNGEGRGCGSAVGWFVVDSITYSGAVLETVDIRFEQRCVYSTGVLRGKIHWDATDTPQVPGPAAPPPNLWQPALGTTPATGNYIYFEVPTGNFVDSGQTFLYTQANSNLSVRTRVAYAGFDIEGDESWVGDFQGMTGIDKLQVGYYGNLKQYPEYNPVVGGVSWRGDNLLCGAGWFVVDAVVYEGETLKSIDLRFEQSCGLPTTLLRGKIHWSADDTTVATGPTAPPAGLWQPSAGATPSLGTYAYFETLVDASLDPPRTYLYTPDNAEFFVDSGVALLMVRINGDARWSGELQGMNSLSQFEVGYYGDLQRYFFHNPAKGGISWSSTATSGCNTLTGWFVVDAVTYDGATLTSIEVRFAQRCTGSSSVLHGKLRWSR